GPMLHLIPPIAGARTITPPACRRYERIQTAPLQARVPEQVVTGLYQFALRFSRGDLAGAARRSMRGHRTSAATNRASAGTQPAWAGRFLPAGSSQGSTVLSDTPFALLLPAMQKSLRRKPFNPVTTCSTRRQNGESH